MRVLFIDVGKKEYRVRIIEHPRIKGALDLGIYLHLEEYRSYNYGIFDPENVVVFGSGNLNYGGTNRGIAVFRSPLHGGLHSSTIGDLGEYLKIAGYDAIVIEGKSEKEVLVIINDDVVLFMEDNIPEDIFEKEKELYNKLKEVYGNKRFRVVLVGLGSKYTKYGVLVSSKPGKEGIVPSVAGRGGAGSVLYRAHNVVGIVIGGSKNVKIEQYDIKKVMEATKKYREAGTFYANYPHLKDTAPILNWSIFYLDKGKRMELYKKFIEGVLLKDYRFENETCGEKCVAVCKKVEKNVKLDYEPVNGLGPFIGIFNRDLIRELIHLTDKYGLDAIYLGYILGLVMEALDKGLIKLEDLGLREKPILDAIEYDKDYSSTNYRIALELIRKIVNGELEILGENIRKIAKEFNIQDLAFYIPLGEEFDMTPNFYWSLGLFLPIIMHGKYFSHYGTVVQPPEEYAKVCADRTLKEYVLDNLGVCRFHRAWVETYIINQEMIENAKYWIRKLFEYKEKANAKPVFWESVRVIDVVKALFREFNQEYDPKDYWERWKKVYEEYFS